MYIRTIQWKPVLNDWKLLGAVVESKCGSYTAS